MWIGSADGVPVGTGRRGPQGEINVTPLIDIVLVLLIIFMVMTPVMLKELTAKVPQKQTENIPQPPGDNPIVVELDRHDTLTLNGETPAETLAERVAERLQHDRRRSCSSRLTTTPTTAAPCGSWTSARAPVPRRSGSSPRTSRVAEPVPAR